MNAGAVQAESARTSRPSPLRRRRVERHDLELRNRLCTWRSGTPLHFLQRRWSVSLGAATELRQPALQFRTDFADGASACISLSHLALDTLSRLSLGAPMPPALSAHLGLALVEHVLDELGAAWPSALAARSLAQPGAWPNLDALALLTWEARSEDGYCLHGEVQLNRAAGQAWAQARDLRLDPRALRTWGGFPVRLEMELGWTELSITDLRSLRPQDIVLPDRWHGRPDQHLRLRCGPSWAFAASLSESTLTVVGKLDRSMTDPDDAPSNAANLPEDLPVRLTFVLGEKTLPLGELMRLQPGVVFELGTDPACAVTLKANGVAVADGELVDVEGRVGVQVVRLHGCAP